MLNLWASWCPKCQAELTKLTKDLSKLEAAGIKIIALSVDGLNSQAGTPDEARSWMKKLSNPFQSAMATPKTLTKIQILHDLIFEKRGQLTLPTSIVIDPQGNLSGFLEGHTDTAQLLKHAEVARMKNTSTILANSLPFPGRWLAEPIGFRLTEYGDTLLKNKFHQEAEVLLKENETRFLLDPSFPDFLGRLALQTDSQNETTRALTYLKRAAELRPNHGPTHTVMGDLLGKIGEIKSAEENYRRAIKSDPSLINARFNLGIILGQQGRSAEAFEQYQLLLESKPDHVMALANCAVHHMQNQKLPEAIHFLERAIKVKPDFIGARFQLGRLLETTGKIQEAIVHYEKILELNPSHAPAATRLVELED